MRVDQFAQQVAFALTDIFMMMKAVASKSKIVQVFYDYYINVDDLTIFNFI